MSPVPATTGSLRTRIENMQIGDYIVCNYQASSGAAGTFSNLGGTAGTEIPVTGSATPNGTFYFVKVDKGLLVSDRVVQHSISWNTLNNANFIEGNSSLLLINKSSSHPTLGSNIDKDTTPSSVSDGFYSSVWITDTVWIQYDYIIPIVTQEMKIMAYQNTNGYEPIKDFRIVGSNDNFTTEDLIYQGTALTATSGGYIITRITLDRPVKYKQFRLYIDSWYPFNQGNGQLVNRFIINHFNKVRSLTGGVAYADANGNSSTTDQGYGGWPTNNEWDKYIVNFPQELIQEGKTIDDVFNIYLNQTAPGSWCQETPINGVVNSSGTSANNTYRVWRGSFSEKRFNHSLHNYVGVQVGFRPVLEYKEV